MTLCGKVCIVTGASRGIGKGIALQLGEAGATVYITGRTVTPVPDDPIGGSLSETAKEIELRGGKCIPVQCDHSKDEDIQKLFDKVKIEQDGRLDILVNNAYSGVKVIGENLGKEFWNQPLSVWDTINNVGLRNHYMCAVHAAKMMVPRKQGLIVNISSLGGLTYIFNIPYGIGKEACDRMAADCSKELQKYNVTFVSLWPDLVQTETLGYLMENGLWSTDGLNEKNIEMRNAYKRGETIEYAGRAIVHLAKDPNIIKKTGKVLITGELGAEYGFTDVDGGFGRILSYFVPFSELKTTASVLEGNKREKYIPWKCRRTSMSRSSRDHLEKFKTTGLRLMNGRVKSSMRQLNSLLKANAGTVWLGRWIPDFIKVPYWMLALIGNKF